MESKKVKGGGGWRKTEDWRRKRGWGTGIGKRRRRRRRRGGGSREK